MWKEFKKWVGETLKDERGNYSSRRFIGIFAGLTLCITLFLNSFYPEEIKPSDALVDSVLILAVGSLGLASVDKIWGKVQTPSKPKENEVSTSEEPIISPE